ncbi:phage tail protein [Pseudomonas sp. NY15181]|uniref:phage tail protein n=1 Tax=Pseudomonas sp. NY15181 TaxID=3400349 RepID=UPI003A893FA2
MSDPFLGEIKMFGGNFAPRGFAFCAGQIMSIAQNTALFSLLGTTYGGNGQTTFGLPDLRSRTPVGASFTGAPPGLSSVALGQVGGTENVTLTSNQLPTHVHAATFTGSASAVAGSAAIDVGTSTASPMVPPAQGATTYLSATTAKAGPANVAFSGLFSGTAPDATKASLGGVTLQGNVTPTGTVAVAAAGNGLPFSVLSPYLGINFIIALEGIFPSRN